MDGDGLGREEKKRKTESEVEEQYHARLDSEGIIGRRGIEHR